MNAPRLTSRQQAQAAYLQTVAPKLDRMRSVIEQMGALQADETTIRAFTRSLDELKANTSALNLSALAETAGLMSTLARRGGGIQMKVRGLRELWGSLKVNYEGALRQATTPEPAAGDGCPTGG
ncbi:MAG TPA: hypothetical protein VFW66_10195 [Gemmatimonadales bacterium]|nr:hypothetical protein [Gemmatimonadales bacterium]